MENTRMMRRKTREQRRKLMPETETLWAGFRASLHPDLPGVCYWKDPGR